MRPLTGELISKGLGVRCNITAFKIFKELFLRGKVVGDKRFTALLLLIFVENGRIAFFFAKGLQNADEWYNNANGTLIGFTTFNEDNFLSHAIYDVQSYAPMKPIEDSYGLDDDEPGVTGVTPTQKA